MKTAKVILLEHGVNAWDDFCALLPPGWRQTFIDQGAMKGLRNDKDPNHLLQVMMMHLAGPTSLRETAARARELKLGDFSAVALFKRLRKCRGAFQELCRELLSDRLPRAASGPEIPLHLIDATEVQESGLSGTRQRIHFCLSYPSLNCDYLTITKATGSAAAENFTHFPMRRRELYLGDRGYSLTRGLAYQAAQHAWGLVRYSQVGTKLYSSGGHNRFNLEHFLARCPQPGNAAETTVTIKPPEDSGQPPVTLRLCILHKSERECQKSRAALKRQATRRQTRQVQARTRRLADYLILLTTAPGKKIPLALIFQFYRLRWQVELAFKRFKSIAGLGNLPTHSDASAKAWLYGKLCLALLMGKLSAQLDAFSPWRPLPPGRRDAQLLAGIQALVEGGHHLDSRSGAASPTPGRVGPDVAHVSTIDAAKTAEKPTRNI